MTRSGRGGLRLWLDAAGVAAFAWCGLVAVGALATAGARLASPDLLALGSARDALGASLTFGLAALRVPLEARDVTGAAAPLTGAAVALVALVSGTRSRLPGTEGSRRRRVAAVAVAFAAVCTLTAAFARAPGLRASIPWAAIAGLTWGAAGAWWATRGGPGAGRTGVSLRERLGASPSVTLLAVAGAGATLWLFVAGVVLLLPGDLGPGAFAGAVLLAVSFAPNVLTALVALGCGARVDLHVVVSGGDAWRRAEGIALWDWSGGTAPWYFLALVAVPLLATIVAAAGSSGPWLRRGVRNGAVLGAALFALGWAGAFEAVEPGGDATVRLGVELLPALVLGVLWGIAGSALHAAATRSRVRS